MYLQWRFFFYSKDVTESTQQCFTHAIVPTIQPLASIFKREGKTIISGIQILLKDSRNNFLGTTQYFNFYLVALQRKIHLVPPQHAELPANVLQALSLLQVLRETISTYSPVNVNSTGSGLQNRCSTTHCNHIFTHVVQALLFCNFILRKNLLVHLGKPYRTWTCVLLWYYYRSKGLYKKGILTSTNFKIHQHKTHSLNETFCSQIP